MTDITKIIEMNNTLNLQIWSMNQEKIWGWQLVTWDTEEIKKSATHDSETPSEHAQQFIDNVNAGIDPRKFKGA